MKNSTNQHPIESGETSKKPSSESFVRKLRQFRQNELHYCIKPQNDKTADHRLTPSPLNNVNAYAFFCRHGTKASTPPLPPLLLCSHRTGVYLHETEEQVLQGLLLGGVLAFARPEPQRHGQSPGQGSQRSIPGCAWRWDAMRCDAVRCDS